jgi:phenylpropionate dioxygenase-like ring-hydroxylating dioxygenase large terminal subunit
MSTLEISEPALVANDGRFIRRALFFDPTVYEAERRQIFQRCWLFVGHESQIQSPHDFFRSYMGEEPVIVTRTGTGRIEVLVNSCSHRGTPVCTADEGNAPTFTCRYHGWCFGSDGRLLGVPHLDAYGGALDKDAWGLHRAAHVESRYGLIFATFDPEAVPLAQFLGDDLCFYLETVFGRHPEGTAVVAGVHRWRIGCNWKVPCENQCPDLYHADPTHEAALRLMGADTGSLSHTVQSTTREGHGFAFRMLPPESDPDERLPGFRSADLPEASSFLRSRQAEAEQRLGPVRARIAPVAGNVFPNFSIVPSVFSIRVNHPRGPGSTEVWSWCVAPANAPEPVRRELLSAYMTTLGPGGLVEEEDGANWTTLTAGASRARTDLRPLNVSMAIGDEFTDPDLPGLLGPMWSEHNQRGFYRTWSRWMGRVCQ